MAESQHGGRHRTSEPAKPPHDHRAASSRTKRAAATGAGQRRGRQRDRASESVYTPSRAPGSGHRLRSRGPAASPPGHVRSGGTVAGRNTHDKQSRNISFRTMWGEGESARPAGTRGLRPSPPAGLRPRTPPEASPPGPRWGLPPPDPCPGLPPPDPCPGLPPLDPAPTSLACAPSAGPTVTLRPRSSSVDTCGVRGGGAPRHMRFAHAALGRRSQRAARGAAATDTAQISHPDQASPTTTRSPRRFRKPRRTPRATPPMPTLARTEPLRRHAQQHPLTSGTRRVTPQRHPPWPPTPPCTPAPPTPPGSTPYAGPPPTPTHPPSDRSSPAADRSPR
jgi:hypothetical protein